MHVLFINEYNYSHILPINDFSGGIPRFIGNLTSLKILSLGKCGLGGRFFAIFSTELVEYTKFSKPCFKCFFWWPSFIDWKLFELSTLSISLNLGGNQLSGELPQEVGNLKNLNEIILENNRLSGDLPTTISSCSSLVNLDISNNFFQGTLKSSLRSLRAIQTFDASQNNFTTKIPTYLEEIRFISNFL
ncbi:unnamed protein product [Lactuca saligna]|uniref:Non-specific serine/threonine protein kinase n=1 Tax=Lactuca saligna TaxID=75948 RepID=A0AA35ZXH5_LACSI|nr:unnamed protein product [Lactuca saligna]